MSRLLSLIAGLVIAFAPLAASGAPSPSPTLDTVLAPAPSSDYEESKPSEDLSIGPIDAAKYATDHASDPSEVQPIQQALGRAGFIAGYGRSWVSLAAGNVLDELVLAFTSDKGAKTLLAANEQADKADPTYVGAVTIPGLDSYYAASFHKASDTLPYSHDVGFMKGNDYFFVTVWSDTDDGGRLLSTQGRIQYDLAPPYTIPPSEWPQTIPGADTIVTWVLRLGIPLAALTLLLLRYRRPRTNLAGASLQLSPDGRFWWDGSEWKDTEQGIPPNAQRSADGNYWWDGSRWRTAPPRRRLF